MSTQDTVLSIDEGPEDCLYRIFRKDGREQRVVYVLLQHLELIPPVSRTYGPDVTRELSKLADWNGRWHTLTISKDDAAARFTQIRYLFNIRDLEPIRAVKTRVSQVQVKGRRCFLKIARFEFEVAALAQEVRAYETLTGRDSKLVPHLLGYAYEETPDRVIGFVLEEISGRHPGIEDLTICRKALQRLHGLNVVHGDVNKYNILVTQDGVKFIDLEVSEIDSNDRVLMDREMQDLEKQLLEESNKGRPWQ